MLRVVKNVMEKWEAKKQQRRLDLYYKYADKYRTKYDYEDEEELTEDEQDALDTYNYLVGYLKETGAYDPDDWE